MTTNTFSTFTTNRLEINDNAYWSRSKIVAGRIKRPKYPPEADIDAWLTQNAPATFQELADIRYVLYHRCSRARFTVDEIFDDRFALTGRHSTLHIISDKARHYLLWKLRQLGRKEKWINALPRTRKAS